MSTNVEQIKERLSIVDVISLYIKVEKAGINFKARCPFHNEKTPSFFISPQRQSFYCFGCGEKGDIFSFVEKFEGLDFKGALEILADKAGVKLEKFGRDSEDQNKEKNSRLFEIMEEATKMYETRLSENKNSLEYLAKRGLSEDSIKKWRLGLAKDEWRNLHDHLTKKGFSKEEMVEAGLVKRVDAESGGSGVKFYDTFRDRVMFPIFDTAERVVAFSGRTQKDTSTAVGKTTPKYLNSPETKLFKKSEVLYGFNVAKNHIRKLDYAVLVEGQMDMIMSHQSGITNTVASSGTALSLLHLQKIKKLSNKVIVAYDADTAGEKASRRAAELAISLEMETKIASLKDGEDPASAIKTDPNIWKNALKEASHFTDFVIESAWRRYKGRELTREILINILPITHLIKSEIEKSQFIKKIASKMGVSEEAVWKDIKKIDEIEKNDEEKIFYPRKEEGQTLEKIMSGLVFFEELTENSIDKNIDSLRASWQKIRDPKEVGALLEEYEKDKEALIFEIENSGLNKNIKKAGEDLLKRIELKSLKRKLQETAILLDDKKLSEEDEKKTKKDFEKVQNRIKELNIYES